MRAHCLFFVLFIFSFQSGFGQNQISLSKALETKVLEITCRGLGGYQGKKLELILKNTGSQILNLNIPAGQMFLSEDSSVQDLVITKSQQIALGAKASKKAQLYTMCTQSKNISPAREEKFITGQMASPALHRLVQRIDAGNYQNSTAQSAIWSISDRESIENVFGEEREMVWDLAEVISEERNIDINDFDFTPRRHQITDIKTSLEYLSTEDIQQGKLVLVNEAGSIVRTYFEDRFYEKGFHQWKVGASHSLGQDAVLFLKLLDGERLVSEKKVLVTDSITTLKDYHSQSILSYEVEHDLQADIGIFDQQNQLYFLIKEDHLIKKGFHRGRYIAKCQLPPDQDYFCKVLAGSEVLAEEKISAEKKDIKLYPKKKIYGVFPMEIEEAVSGASLGIYDESENLKRILYKIKHLNPGKRQITYNFEHHAGPGAVFYIRLVDSTGNIIQENKIISK